MARRRAEIGGSGLRSRVAGGTIVNTIYLLSVNGLTIVQGLLLAGLLGAGEYGLWGLLAPRGGWGTGSDPVASAIAFYRAVDVAALPGAHTIIRPSFIPATLVNNINLGFPRLSQCMKPGFPPILWEWGTGSATGNYLWVWYQRRTCCIDPEEVCTSVARYRDPLLTVACARIKESPPSASPAFRRDPVTVNLRLAG